MEKSVLCGSGPDPRTKLKRYGAMRIQIYNTDLYAQNYDHLNLMWSISALQVELPLLCLGRRRRVPGTGADCPGREGGSADNHTVLSPPALVV